jgi:hypothetical protein
LPNVYSAPSMRSGSNRTVCALTIDCAFRDVSSPAFNGSNFGRRDSGTFITATNIFNANGVQPAITTLPHQLAVDQLRRGEIAAMVYVATKLLSRLSGEGGLRRWEPMVCRLSAGGKRIRTLGPALAGRSHGGVRTAATGTGGRWRRRGQLRSMDRLCSSLVPWVAGWRECSIDPVLALP